MEDLDDIHRILDVELKDVDLGTTGAVGPDEREQWLRWTIMGYTQLANLKQPPYGDRAITLKTTGHLIGACGFVPCLMPFELPPSFSPGPGSPSTPFNSTEFGLYYALSPAHQRQGLATEAVQRMVDFAFMQLGISRIVATTTHDNAPSIAVMQRVGMRIEKNPNPQPPWFQVVGILDNRS